MTPNDALTVISICGIVGTAFNVYLSLKIANSVGTVKLWVREHFLAKEDFYRYKRTDGI